MVAVCVADESSAITRGSAVGGTIAGGNVCNVVASKERAAPSANTAARIEAEVARPDAVAKASTATATASTPCATSMMRLRSC